MAPRIIFLDDHLVAVDKPAGMMVHRGLTRDPVVLMTAVRDLVGRYVYPVHRLDRGASGVLCFALTREAARGMHRMFAGGEVSKRYLAIVRGTTPETGVIDHAISPREGAAKAPAVTEFRRLHAFRVEVEDEGPYPWLYSMVEARPRTGRLHQIRRHLKHINHPLVGDVRYGKGEHNRLFRDRFGLHRLALHALSLEFPHPVSGVPVSVAAPVPADLRHVCAEVGFNVDKCDKID